MKYLICLLLVSSVFGLGSRYDGSTTSAVTLAGGIIKSTHIEPSDHKYLRKNCPVCKGTGKYLSGDGIKMVDCGYCEPDKKQGSISKPIEIVHPPVKSNNIPQCTSPYCKVRK
jgi:hypothetical protein